MSDEGTWHLDKRIPLALLITLGIQTGGVFFYMGQLTVRVDQTEAQLIRASNNSDRLTRLEVQLEQANRTLSRIVEKLDE